METNYSGYDFILLAPQQLAAAVQLIYPGLTEVQRQARKKGLDWQYLNLLKEIELNMATLTIIQKDGVYAGFTICKSIIIGLPNKHFYQVLVVYVEPDFRNLEGTAYNAAEDYVTDFAIELKCQGLWHEYFREGHTKRLEKRGYRVRQITAVKEF
jgi:hypothetical protein